MGKINVLSTDTAALIAAGEVVERPASVVKELVENSIDAGAENITVEIKNGGISYIRVCDDGEGIAAEDVPTAFLRHATSKIANGDDLENILTLGFRGEALYSIAAVSNLTIYTAHEGEMGTVMEISGGACSAPEEAGCPKGTTITVKNLFFNTPARMKFLKKDSSEAGAVEDILRKIALAKPYISFKLISGGKEVFFTPGDGNLKNAVWSVLGKDIARGMEEVLYEESGIKVSGLCGKAETTRGNRNGQIFFVNGRCVTNKNFSFSLGEAYKGRIMTGRFPVAVLNIEIEPALCDVNVHPTKLEVKFADDRAVCGAIYWGVKNALHAVTEQREMVLPPEKAKPFETEKTIAVQREITDIEAEKPQQEKTFNIPPVPRAVPKLSYKAVPQSAGLKIAESDIPPEPKKEIEIIKDLPEAASFPEEDVIKEAEEIQKAEAVKDEIKINILGQLFDTYIVAQVGDEMILCDQHAAHERIIYNRILKEKERGGASQTLLMPEIINLSGSEMSVFLENAEFFEKSGFEAEEFGANTVKISMIPDGLDFTDTEKAFCDMLEILAAGREKIAALHDKALYSLACKAALKAGKVLSCPEQEKLMYDILKLEGEITCPHGRPVILKITKTYIEKQFKRIV